MKRIFEGEPKAALRKGFKHDLRQRRREARSRKYTDYKKMLRNEKDIEAVVIATAAVPARPDGHRRHERSARSAASDPRPVRKADGLEHRPVQGDDPGRRGDRQHPVDRPPAALQHALRPRRRGRSRPASSATSSTSAPCGTATTPGRTSRPTSRASDGQGRDAAVLHATAGSTRSSQEDYDALKAKVKQYGYDSVEQLVRWRLYNATGGGLMAELGSHQLDACSIFLGKVHPLAVSGVGGKYVLPARTSNDREIDDHVFVTYEFPGKNHPHGPTPRHATSDDVVVVTYSSISTNGFETYGECVMGTRGTMIVEAEQTVHALPGEEPDAAGPADAQAMTVTVDASGRASRPWTRPRRGAGRSAPARRRPGRPAAARRPPSAAATARRWRTSPTASACGTQGRLREGRRASTSSGCRAATARWRWRTPSSR